MLVYNSSKYYTIYQGIIIEQAIKLIFGSKQMLLICLLSFEEGLRCKRVVFDTGLIFLIYRQKIGQSYPIDIIKYRCFSCTPHMSHPYQKQKESYMLEFAIKPEIIQIKMPSPENPPSENDNQTPTEQPLRELTQIDRLNNKLLKSFLSAMNSGQVENATDVSANNDEEDRSAEFED